MHVFNANLLKSHVYETPHRSWGYKINLNTLGEYESGGGGTNSRRLDSMLKEIFKTYVILYGGLFLVTLQKFKDKLN